MKPKRKIPLAYDSEGDEIKVGDRVLFQADDGDCPYIEPFTIEEKGIIIQEKRKYYFISDNGKHKINLEDLYDVPDHITLIKE